MDNKLNVQSIFTSLDGEANGFDGAGQLSTFIRLKGCNLRCKYCDTVYAQESAPENLMTVEEIINQIPKGCKKITITGGDPFTQPGGLSKLVVELLDLHKRITIETNGSIDITGDLDFGSSYDLMEFVRLVVDYKLPSSGMEASMNLNLFKKLGDIDVIKFVISDETDYKRACEVIKEHQVEWQAKKVFSPAISAMVMVNVIKYDPSEEEMERIKEILNQQEQGAIVPVYVYKTRIDTLSMDYMKWPRQLAEMMIRDGLYDVQFSLQIHKCLWPGSKVER